MILLVLIFLKSFKLELMFAKALLKMGREVCPDSFIDISFVPHVKNIVCEYALDPVCLH
jgi:hypothetical protein